MVEVTIKGKQAWELYAKSQGVKIKSYHTNNGIFKVKGWVKHCNNQHQAITYAGINAHY